VTDTEPELDLSIDDVATGVGPISDQTDSEWIDRAEQDELDATPGSESEPS
jgi:hypothetical protein